MKTTITILVLLLIIAGIYIFHVNDLHERIDDQEQKLNHESDSLEAWFDSREKLYQEGTIKINRILAELNEYKAQVKRSEDQLAKSKAREVKALKAKKEEVLKMTDMEADSAIRQRFISDPDSILQKVEFDLERLSYCDSLAVKSDSVLQNYRKQTLQSDSVISLLSASGQVSRDQISILLSSQDKDKQVIEIKTKENKKVKRENKLLRGGIIAAIVYGIIQSFN